MLHSDLKIRLKWNISSYRLYFGLSPVGKFILNLHRCYPAKEDKKDDFCPCTCRAGWKIPFGTHDFFSCQLWFNALCSAKFPGSALPLCAALCGMRCSVPPGLAPGAAGCLLCRLASGNAAQLPCNYSLNKQHWPVWWCWCWGAGGWAWWVGMAQNQQLPALSLSSLWLRLCPGTLPAMGFFLHVFPPFSCATKQLPKAWIRQCFWLVVSLWNPCQHFPNFQLKQWNQ